MQIQFDMQLFSGFVFVPPHFPATGLAGSGSASTERTSEEHSSIEGQAGINMCQIDPFCGSAPTNLSHNMNTKIIKESCNPDATNQPHDATHENVDAGNHSHHIHQIVSILF